MCDCIEKFDESLKEKFPDYEDVKLKTVYRVDLYAEGSGMKIFPEIAFTYKKKRGKKGYKFTKTIFFDYCPFCGKKYE